MPEFEPFHRQQVRPPGAQQWAVVKQLARFNRVGHGITGDPRQASSPGAGDEKGSTTVGFLSRALAWFIGQGTECRRVRSDNGSAKKVLRLAESCSGHGTEGQADQALRDALRHLSRQKRPATGHLRIEYGRRCPMALGGLTPQQRLTELLA